MDAPGKPTFRSAFLFWLKLGFISFGGPAGQISIMHNFLVEKKRWISNTKFLHALNYCMLLPGPEAQQLATYIGWLLHGVKGGLVAGILFLLPSVFILLALSIVYVTYGELEWVAAIFTGLKPAVVAIVMHALFKIGKKSLTSPLHYIIAASAFVAIYFLHIPFPIIIVASLFAGLIVYKFYNSQNKKDQQLENEEMYFLKTSSQIPFTDFTIKKFLLQVFIFIIMWCIPISILFFTQNDAGNFWNTLVIFFTKAAFVTFGGAYAVLPYVAQVSVEQYHWLTELQMIDGLALGETTPGPLIMVLSFVGFMAGFSYTGGSIFIASIALLITVYYTFLPCFFFIFAGGPIMEKTQNNAGQKSVLKFVTAAVVGVILNLAVYFSKAVLFIGDSDNIQLLHAIGIIISIILLYRFKVNMLYLLLAGAGFGYIFYILF